jgi:hypothetical protein
MCILSTPNTRILAQNIVVRGAFKIREYIIDTNEMDRVNDAGPIRLLGISDTHARNVDKREGSCHGQDGFMERFE